VKRILQKRYIKTALAEQKEHPNPPSSLQVGQLMFLQKETQWELIEHSRAFFAKRRADWHLLLYIHSSQPNIPEAYKQAPWLSILSSKEVNWLGLPQAAPIGDFLSRDYSILLNSAQTDCFPLLYVLAQTRSVLKIGSEYSALTPLDFYDVVLGGYENEAEWGDLLTQCFSIIKPEYCGRKSDGRLF
jgi:hypothetical protein